MATIRLQIATAPAALLEQAVTGLFPLRSASADNPWPTLDAWLVLRQGGLRDDLHRLAAAQGVAGWFDPPVCVFGELASRWGTNPRAPLSTAERIALLTTLATRDASAVFGDHLDAWIPPLDRLIGEWISEGITPDALTAALTGHPATDAAQHDEFTARRNATIAALYSAWHHALAERQRTDPRAALVHLAADIDRHPDRFAAALGHRRDIRIVGLADLRGGWRTLLAALHRSSVVDTVTVFTSHALTLPEGIPDAREATTHERASSGSGAPSASDGAAAFARALFTSETPTAAPVICLEAPDSAREIETIAVRVRALLDQGVPPHRIAITARDARPRIDAMADALERVGVPVTARRRTGLAHTGPARAISALLTVAIDDWSRHSMVELADSPLLSLGLDTEVLNIIGRSAPVSDAAEWSNALAALRNRCELRDRQEAGEAVPERGTADRATPDRQRRQPLPPTARVIATEAAWQALSDVVATLTTSRPAADWFAWIITQLTDSRWEMGDRLQQPPAGDLPLWRTDGLARDRLIALAAEWQQAYTTMPGHDAPITVAAFASRLRLLLDEDLITHPDTGAGVIVAEALAVGWRAVDYLFVLGMSAGEFPRRVPPGALLGTNERLRLLHAGLPVDPPDAWRERERELFRVLCAAPQVQLTLSWPLMGGSGRAVPRSAFADDALLVAGRAAGLTTDSAYRSAGLLVAVRAETVCTPGFPLVTREDLPGRTTGATDRAIANAHTAATREAGRTVDRSPWNGEITDPAWQEWLAERYGDQYQWSATQLETLAMCPWRWFADRLLRLERPDEPDDMLDSAERGTLLHLALQRFVEAGIAERGAPLYLRADDLSWASALMDRALDDAWRERSAVAWLGAESLREVARNDARAKLLGYLAYEIDWNEKSFKVNTTSRRQIRTGAMAVERWFENVRITVNDLAFRLRGAIDRIDRGCDSDIPGSEHYLAAIDYKSSKKSTPGSGASKAWDDGIVLQVPLYAEVLQQLYPNDQLARMEYRTLNTPDTVHMLSLAPVTRTKAFVGLNPEGAQLDKKTAALESAARQVRRVRTGALPIAPTASAGCSSYCVARDICRIPGGPVNVEGW